MNQKKLTMISLIGSIVFAVIAVVLLILGIALDFNSAVTRVLVIIVAVLCLAVAGEGMYFFFLMRDTKPNYFLYNHQTKRNISVQKLTPLMIGNRMNRYLAGYASTEDKIWTDRILDNPFIEMGDEFKPLVAYKLLLDLAEFDKEEGWRCFEKASDETVQFIVAALKMNGENNLADTLVQMKSAQPINLNQLRNYIIGNRKYLQNKMYRYVCSNIQRF